MHFSNLAIKTCFRPATLQLALFCGRRHSVSSLNQSCEDPTTGPGGVFWRQTVALGEGMPCRVSYSIRSTKRGDCTLYQFDFQFQSLTTKRSKPLACVS